MREEKHTPDEQRRIDLMVYGMAVERDGKRIDPCDMYLTPTQETQAGDVA